MYSRMDQVKFVEYSLLKILLGPFLNTLSQMIIVRKLLAFSLTQPPFCFIQFLSRITTNIVAQSQILLTRMLLPFLIHSIAKPPENANSDAIKGHEMVFANKLSAKSLEK